LTCTIEERSTKHEQHTRWKRRTKERTKVSVVAFYFLGRDFYFFAGRKGNGYEGTILDANQGDGWLELMSTSVGPHCIE